MRLPVLLLALLSLGLRLPAFDHEGIEASVVVTLPPGYDEARRWPLILDFHGAIAPTAKGAEVTARRLWRDFVKEVPVIVAGLNGRTRAWGTIRGEKDDVAYAKAALREIARRYSVDPERIFAAGFSSGSDFLCRSGLAADPAIAGCLIVCPGPANVLGLARGEFLEKKAKPFFFLTGEEDYVRKSGAFDAFLALTRAGGRAAYREVPGVAHEFPDIPEYAEAFRALVAMARGEEPPRPPPSPEAAKAALGEAAAIDAAREPGRAFEAYWSVLVRFCARPEIARRAREGMAAIEKALPRRDLYRSRRDWFRRRGAGTPAEIEARRRGSPRGMARAFGFDRYLTFREVVERLGRLAKEHPDRARLLAVGKSIEGRDILVLEVTDRGAGPPEGKPAVYAEGGIHGNEVSSVMTVLYFAWQLAANPERSRGIERILRDTTFYLAPVVNPDAHHHCLTEPHSPWRPRFNYRPNDADGDGRMDEDPYEDLNGDGEISPMYVPDPEGPYVVTSPGRLGRGKAAGPQRYRAAGLEGIDNDGDGKYSEDRPGGVNLNRNFPVGFSPRRDFEGSRGDRPASEPETRAVMDFVTAHDNIALFLDYHNNANCVFTWLGPEGTDEALLAGLAERIRDSLGYTPRPLRHRGAGLAIAWATGARGIPAAIVELESSRGDRERYYETAWKGEAFLPARPFRHPQLGEILIGNDYKKIPRRNLHPDDLFWQVDRNFAWLKTEVANLPRLALRDPEIAVTGCGFRVRGRLANTGIFPTDTGRAIAAGRAGKIRAMAEGARIETSLLPLRLGGRDECAFLLDLDPTAEDVTLFIDHPRAGRIELPIRRRVSPTVPIRNDYEIPAGYATVETARSVPAPSPDRGPAFSVPRETNELRLAVLLGDWEDHPHSFPASAFRAALFSRSSYHRRSPTGQPVYGSLADFYAEMSYGRLAVTGRVFPWVTLPGSYAGYRDASFGSGVLHRRLIAAVRAKYGPDALDGFDALAIVWAGNAVRRTSMLWPMRLRVRDPKGVVAFKTSERLRGEFLPIGVACHELAHTFGVNDKYGLGASEKPLGPWCLMGKGTHGGEPSGRHRPFPLCAWCRMVIGWLKPTVIDPSTPQKLALRPISYGPREACRILIEPDGSEYLLVTNRRREGFLTDLPSAGLVVLHVGPNDKPMAPQSRVRLLPAHGLPPAHRSDPAKPAAIAWPQPGHDELVVRGVKLSGIRIVDDVALFTVSRE